jgi:1,4-alpha-glucan branching enzyme
VANGDTLFFRLPGYENAKKVFVAGTFNKWNNQELPMVKKNGGWELPYILPAGNYEYKFIVDSKWIPDPYNAVRAGNGVDHNSVLPVKANHQFRLKGFENANQVVVSGTFNEWNPEGYTLKREGNEWVLWVYLPPGKTLYKFIVDGRWVLDPDNDLWEQNEHNTGNSVLWMGYQ